MRKYSASALCLLVCLIFTTETNAQCGADGTQPCPSSVKKSSVSSPAAKSKQPAKTKTVPAKSNALPAAKSKTSSKKSTESLQQQELRYVATADEKCEYENTDCKIEILNKAIEIYPKSASAYYERGRVYERLKNYEKAINDYSKAIEFDSEFEQMVLGLRARVYSLQKQYKEALRDYSRMITLNPTNYHLYLYRADVYRVLGDVDSTQKDEKLCEIVRINDQKRTWADAVDGGVINSKATFLAQPEYPEEARKKNVSGEVRIVVIINPNGTKGELLVVSGDPLLREAAITAAVRSRFQPMTIDGKNMRYIGVIVYNFVNK